ncbi:unnamed protein product [Pleuronectes platessa]|uniref:Uncharacterized protein n=1 Tax=Pleuronectes platessa TaxID=8262 RepID=A0A9N7TK10_PLEPL|nr:unnamed protein product [Pleuronectes platessa]
MTTAWYRCQVSALSRIHRDALQKPQVGGCCHCCCPGDDTRGGGMEGGRVQPDKQTDNHGCSYSREGGADGLLPR